MPHRPLGRRQALRLLAGAATAPLLLRHGLALGNTDTPFALGVASGDPWPDGFVIWTRLARLPLFPGSEQRLPERVPVHWEVASDPQMRHVVQRGASTALRLHGHAVHVELRGLAPGRPYWYRFSALGERSAVGRGLTVPAPGTRSNALKLLVASCANWERGHFSAYRHMAAEDPDLVLFLGDYIYEYSLPGSARVVRRYEADEALDLAGYRYRYALHRSDPDLQAAHAACPWIATWDDHEVQDDYAGPWSKDPAGQVAFARRRAAAYQAFLENMPVRRPRVAADGSVRLYRWFRYGDLASIPVLDGRQYRSRQPCAERPPYGKGHIEATTCRDLVDPSRTQLGWAQERWLYDGLRRHDAHWTLIAQNLLVAPLRIPDPAGGVERYWSDSWDGYQAARDRLLQAIASQRTRNTVVLSGDYHSFWANELHLDSRDPDSPRVACELVATSITSDGPSQRAIQAVLPHNPQIRFFDSRWRGYIAIDLNRERLAAALRTISDRDARNATLGTLRRPVVEAGSARLFAD